MALGPYHCLLKWNVQGRPAANVLYYDLNQDPGVSYSDAQAVADFVNDAWKAHIVQLASAAAVYLGVIVTAEDKSGKYEINESVSGGGSGGALPPNSTYLIRKNLLGTSKSGRLYFPGVAESQVDDGGNVSGSIITAFDAQFELFLAQIELSTTDVLAVKGFVNGGPTPNYYTIDSFKTDGKIASQRRRLRG